VQDELLTAGVIMTAFDIHSGWWAQAHCQTAEPELFFPISALEVSDRDVAEAKAICGPCRVRPQCLAHAMNSGPVQGIWGGTTEEERRLLRGRMRKANRASTAM
jgi:WhiB family redox-sensing transcriptional regulator